MRVGLFGGSFDPAHSGHLLVAETALKRLRLDQIWWLVTPQNPLKARKSRPIEARMMSAAAMTQGPRMVVTDIETRLKVRYSADTIEALQRKYPGVRFVWIMGGDNLLSFHRWRNWRRIVERVPVAIVARSAGASRSRAAPAFARYLKARKNETQAAKLPLLPAPAWLYLPVRLDPTSSTSLRARGR